MANNAINWENNPTYSSEMTTELNSLADNARAIITSAINNSGHDVYMDFRLYIAAQGSARDTGGFCKLYLLKSDADSNWPRGGASDEPSYKNFVDNFLFDAATTARYESINGVLVPPGYYKTVIENQTGQALASTGNILAVRLYSKEVQ